MAQREKTPTFWFRRGLIALGGALAVYAVLVGALFVMQRSLLYHPGGGVPVPDPAGPPIETLRIETADDEILTAWFLPAARERPTFLYLGGNAERLAQATPRWRRIADTGAGFLAVAYRGYDGSTGQPSESGLHEDARAAYDWLTAHVPPGDIVIHGVSLGAGPAARLASERPARALVLEAPYASMTALARDRYWFVPVGLLLRDQFRIHDWIGDAQMPVLIVHGGADEVIPIRYGETVFDLAPAPKRFVRIHGSDHNGLTRDGLYDHVWRFLGVPFSGTTAAQDQPADYEITSIGEAAGQDAAAPL